MKTHKLLLILLVVIAIAMVVIGIVAKIPAPALTGIGFIIIAYLYKEK